MYHTRAPNWNSATKASKATNCSATAAPISLRSGCNSSKLFQVDVAFPSSIDCLSIKLSVLVGCEKGVYSEYMRCLSGNQWQAGRGKEREF